MSEEINLAHHNSSFEIDCLRVEKVFDACSTRVCETIDFDPECDRHHGESGTIRFDDIASILNCEGLDGAEVIGEIISRPGTPIAEVKTCIKGFVKITVRSTSGGIVKLIRKVHFDTRVLLFAPRPRSMTIGGEALIRCLGCVLHPETQTIRCAVGVFVIIKTLGLVELRIPVYGICPVPDECTVLAEANACEVFLNRQLTHFPPAKDFFPPQQDC